MSEASSATHIVFRVGDDEAGERVDKVVLAHLEGSGRRRVAELFRSGSVKVGGRISKKGNTVRANDEVTIRLAPAIRPEPELGLDVQLVTPDVVVVDKPAGQPTAPAHDGDTGTLAGALLGAYPEMQGVGYRAREPGLLHRLDTETSGLVVAARSARAFGALRRGLDEGRIEKRYLAIVLADGLPDDGVIDAPLEPDAGDGRRVVVASGPGARAGRVTRFHKLRRAGPWALVEVSASRAYRHQVRVHLSSIGHPIAGDALYGGPRAPLSGSRHALHASYVAWAGDDDVEGFAVESALPADLVALGFPR